jgi:PAS domain S-box-containing protein
VPNTQTLITQTILESIGDAIYGVGADWTVLFFNRQAERFVGRSRSEIVGRPLWDCFPAAREAETGQALQRVMQTREPVDMVTRSAVTGRWVDLRIFPLEGGGLAVSWRDITEAKEQEAALARALEVQERLVRQFRTVTDHLPAMVAYWDADLKCRFANASYREWFGRAPSEMIGLSIQDLMGEVLFAKNEPHIRAALRGEAQSFERTLQTAAGQIRQTWAQYVPDLHSQGRVLGFYALIVDVSPLKAVEERLREANAELERARDEAQAAVEAKSVFLSNMSHELRNPLTAIIGFAQLLGRGSNLDEVQRRYVGRILEASDALLATINDVLDFSKLEAGQMQIERRPANPSAVGEGALAMFELSMERKGLARRFEAVRAPPELMIDDARVRQILVNLISNAVKFTVHGGVTVRCAYDARRHRLRYEVIDTGPGIPADGIRRLFQRFSQIDGSTSQAAGGAGLGLAICKGLAEAMGGQVGVRSKVGQGSCFWLAIPARPPVAAKAKQGRQARAERGERLRGLRLLIVDDEASNRELVRHTLEPLGVQVVEADGGAAALETARATPFDLVLMDIRMPGIDGPAAARAIRSRPGPNASIPLIAFTADVSGGMRPAWIPLFDGLLAKPIKPAALVRALAERWPRPSEPTTA